jgi:hypothetical protein
MTYLPPDDVKTSWRESLGDVIKDILRARDWDRIRGGQALALTQVPRLGFYQSTINALTEALVDGRVAEPDLRANLRNALPATREWLQRNLERRLRGEITLQELRNETGYMSEWDRKLRAMLDKEYIRVSNTNDSVFLNPDLFDGIARDIISSGTPTRVWSDAIGILAGIDCEEWGFRRIYPFTLNIVGVAARNNGRCLKSDLLRDFSIAGLDEHDLDNVIGLVEKMEPAIKLFTRDGEEYVYLQDTVRFVDRWRGYQQSRYNALTGGTP